MSKETTLVRRFVTIALSLIMPTLVGIDKAIQMRRQSAAGLAFDANPASSS